MPSRSQNREREFSGRSRTDFTFSQNTGNSSGVPTSKFAKRKIYRPKMNSNKSTGTRPRSTVSNRYSLAKPEADPEIIDITSYAQYLKLVESTRTSLEKTKLIVLFYVEWNDLSTCKSGARKGALEHFASTAKNSQANDIIYAKVNVDADLETAVKNCAHNVPMFKFYNIGNLYHNLIGLKIDRTDFDMAFKDFRSLKASGVSMKKRRDRSTSRDSI